MIEETVTISKFKATCLMVLKKVNQTGKPILVTRRGKPIALVTPPPLPPKPKSWLGSFSNKGRITGDIVSPAVAPEIWETLNR